MTSRDLELIMQVAFAWFVCVALVYLAESFVARIRMHARYNKRFTRRGEFSTR
jgi:hypothetical protein